MVFNFTIEDSENFELNYVIYVIQCFGCVFSLLPLIFVLYCWISRPVLRTRRTMFTLYLSTLDSLGRCVYLIYFVIRLLTLDDRYLINDQSCDYLMFFLYNAAVWPLTSVLVLQLHALAASVSNVRYEMAVGRGWCAVTMIVGVIVDASFAGVSQAKLKQRMVDQNWPDLIDNCKFEYFSRFSDWHSWKIFLELILMGVIGLFQLIVVCAKRLRRRRDSSNPVANSPFHQWFKMTKRQQCLTLSMQILWVMSFILFIVTYIVFLVEGNSDAERILTLSVTLFAFLGPIEMIWFNVDLRDAFMKRVLPKEISNDDEIGLENDEEEEQRYCIRTPLLRCFDKRRVSVDDFNSNIIVLK